MKLRLLPLLSVWDGMEWATFRTDSEGRTNYETNRQPVGNSSIDRAILLRVVLECSGVGICSQSRTVEPTPLHVPHGQENV